MLVMEKPLESNLKGSCTCDNLTISQWNSTEYKWQNKMQLCKTGRKGTRKKVNRIIWFWVGGLLFHCLELEITSYKKMLCFLILLCSIWTCLPIIFLIFREAEERECDLCLTITRTVVGFQEEVGEKKDGGPGRYTQNLIQWIPSALLHQQGRGVSPRGQLPSQSQLLPTISTEMTLANQSMCPNIPTILNPAVEGLTILWTSQYMQLPFLPQTRPTGVTCLKLRLVLCTPNAMKLTWLCTAATLKKL